MKKERENKKKKKKPRSRHNVTGPFTTTDLYVTHDHWPRDGNYMTGSQLRMPLKETPLLQNQYNNHSNPSKNKRKSQL